MSNTERDILNTERDIQNTKWDIRNTESKIEETEQNIKTTINKYNCLPQVNNSINTPSFTRRGITDELNESSWDRQYSWADYQLIIDADSANYTLNKMILRPECAPKSLRELLPDIAAIFRVRT